MRQRMRMTKTMMALGLSAAITATAQATPLTLAADGRTRAVIVLPADAMPGERTAATELAEHLQRLTGAVFPIHPEGEVADVEGAQILAGPSAAARALLADVDVDAMETDAFHIRTGDGTLALVGQRPRGSLYAVYSFLEKDLGARWLNWFDEVYLPRYHELRIPPIDRHEAPAFPVRDIIVRTNRMTARDELRDVVYPMTVFSCADTRSARHSRSVTD